jgi:hypothetical protein
MSWRVFIAREDAKAQIKTSEHFSFASSRFRAQYIDFQNTKQS